jgi:CheY-like chemotaxis protein
MTPDDIKPRQTGATVIMVVDDTEGVRRIISMQLRTLGYRVVEARGGLEAVELINREHPSLVLMDINMPGVDGLETTRLIRRTDGISSVPIIGLSAHHGLEMRDKALRAGCDEFAIKPVDFKLLEHLITLHLKS